VKVLTGTLKSGNVGSLAAADGSYYVVSTVNAGAQWSASFTGLPSSIASLTVTYTGHAGASCTQNVNLWNWYYNAWVPIAHTTAGAFDSTLTLPAAGLLSDYLFLGELRVSVQCFRTDAAAFDLSSDLAKIQFS
jgi:hypothetical protein